MDVAPHLARHAPTMIQWLDRVRLVLMILGAPQNRAVAAQKEAAG